MEQNNSSAGAVIGIFNKLSLQQRLLLGGIAAFSLVVLGMVVFMFNEPTYTVLYSDLAPEDASKVVEHLSGAKIPYKLTDNGATVSIPKDKVHEMRLAMAGKGIPSSGIIGYEIFDKNTMGMSEFIQKLNFKRALEGEIARTIMQQQGIEGARVHIVFPERSIFREEQKEPTASVVLKLRTGNTLSQGNVKAVSYLVASSIEGLRPEKVTVIDTKGKLLSREFEGDNPFAVSSNKQYEIKSSVESYLAHKAQSILDNVVGYGNSVVKVNVDLNFRQVEKTMETFDPESQVAVSEQSIKSESAGVNISDSNAVTTENTTTNYELSKTIERVVEGAGNVQRITVAAVINGVQKEVTTGDVTELVFEPRPQDQLDKLERIIRQAVGIDANRQDEISLVSIPFETADYMDDMPAEEEKTPFDDMKKWSNFLLIFIAIGASMFVLKSLMKRLKNEKILIGSVNNYNDNSFDDLMAPAGAGAGAGGGVGSQPKLTTPPPAKKRPLLQVGDIEDEITDEAQEKKMQKDKIVNYASKRPSDAAKLINSWLREDEF